MFFIVGVCCTHRYHFVSTHEKYFLLVYFLRNFNVGYRPVHHTFEGWDAEHSFERFPGYAAINAGNLKQSQKVLAYCMIKA